MKILNKTSTILNDRIEVVIIDDNKSLLWLLQQVLETEHICHKVASTGIDGIKLINEHHPRLAIIDIKLGSVSGIDIAKQIPDICEETKILFITGYTNSVFEIDKNLPVLGILEKPFDVKDFLKILRDVLN